jgi:hypothetical protein
VSKEGIILFCDACYRKADDSTGNEIVLMFVMMTHCIVCVTIYRQLGEGVRGATYT